MSFGICLCTFNNIRESKCIFYISHYSSWIGWKFSDKISCDPNLVILSGSMLKKIIKLVAKR